MDKFSHPAINAFSYFTIQTSHDFEYNLFEYNFVITKARQSLGPPVSDPDYYLKIRFMCFFACCFETPFGFEEQNEMV